MKIGVFGGDLFWSSCPYECLNVYEDVSSSFETDYILFKDDIRINKKFTGNEEFFFEKERFLNCPGLRIIEDWTDFYKISSEYDAILCRCKVAPKTRFPEDMKTRASCPIIAWDVGGLDILTWEARHATHFLVKGKKWLDYITQVKPESHGKSEISLCPQYDPYYRKDLKHGLPLSRDKFFKKYNLDLNKSTLLITPSNPGSHTQHFDQNIEVLKRISLAAQDKDYQVIVKTYPHDYVFYENELPYSGIYKRRYTNKPQYEFLRERIENISIIESQDHYSAMLLSNKVFNMSGSSIAWETFFTNGTSYSINFKNKPYYKNVKYLPENISFPDDVFNIDMESYTEIFQNNSQVEKEISSDFFTRSDKDNISNKLKVILNEK